MDYVENMLIQCMNLVGLDDNNLTASKGKEEMAFFHE
jgi:hypothetical protein